MTTPVIDKEVPIIPDGEEVNKKKIKELHKKGKSISEIQEEVNLPAGILRHILREELKLEE